MTTIVIVLTILFLILSFFFLMSTTATKSLICILLACIGTGYLIYDRQTYLDTGVETIQYGVVVDYPSCGEYDCNVAVQFSLGETAIKQFSVRGQNAIPPVPGEVVKETCTTYIDNKIVCLMTKTGKLQQVSK